jgi:glutamate-1-semialdehyde 2,1-aminomutase
VYQAGTLSGNPLATAAGLAALRELDDDAYDRLERTAARLQDGLRAALTGAGIEAHVPRAFTLVGIFFGTTDVRDYDDATKADHDLHARFFHALLDRSVYFAPSGYETLFPSLAHTDDVVDATVQAAAEAARTL